jgi:adenylosuccinate lyase
MGFDTRSITDALLQSASHEKHIASNLEASACHLSTEALMFGLGAKTGKQQAHELIYELSMKAYTSNRPLKELLEENPDITEKLTPEELSGLLKPENHIGSAPRLAEITVTAAEEWLSQMHPEENLESACPLADRHGDCTLRMEE